MYILFALDYKQYDSKTAAKDLKSLFSQGNGVHENALSFA